MKTQYQSKRIMFHKALYGNNVGKCSYVHKELSNYIAQMISIQKFLTLIKQIQKCPQ